MKSFRIDINADFRCQHCGAYVSASRVLSGVSNRNHCPYCLWSRHLDLFEAGDRLAACKAPMRPVGLHAEPCEPVCVNGGLTCYIAVHRLLPGGRSRFCQNLHAIVLRLELGDSASDDTRTRRARRTTEFLTGAPLITAHTLTERSNGAILRAAGCVLIPVPAS